MPTRAAPGVAVGVDERPRRILHLDVDAFLASVEQAMHPELRGRPLVIGGLPTERNLVMSCSYEARARGVRPGLALREAARRCPEAIFRRGDSNAANRLREETAGALARFSPIVEVASIDDFFVDLTGTERLAGRAFDVAETMRATIHDELTLPVTIGIGANKTMARLAGKLAKPGGIAEIRPGGERAFLGGMPVEQLPGVGHTIGRLLERFAIRTVGDLARVSREVLFATFGRAGLVLHQRARGIDPEPVESTHRYVDGRLEVRAPRAIRRDSTFEPEEGRHTIHEAMIAYLIERAAHRLRQHGLAARGVEVRRLYVDTRTPAQRRAHPEHRPSFETRGSLAATDSTDELLRFARELWRTLPRRRALVKRVGITLASLVRTRGWQGRLFDDGDAPRDAAPHPPGQSHADRQRALDRALDALRQKHGFGKLVRGASLPLVETFPLEPDGFRLRTPSLNQ